MTDEDIRSLVTLLRCPRLGSPVASEAFEIYRTNTPLRWLLEAFTLARDSGRRVGDRCELSPDVVETYLRCFFDVADRLDFADFVCARAIGPRLYAMTEEDVDTYLRHLGYFGGPLVLEELLTGTDPRDSQAGSTLRERLLATTSFGVRVLPVDTPPLRVLRLLDLRSELDQLRAVQRVRLEIQVTAPDPRHVVVTSPRLTRAG